MSRKNLSSGWCSDEGETGTEVDTIGQRNGEKKTRAAHVSWQQIKHRRTVILHGVTVKKKAADSLDSRGKKQKTRGGKGALAQNKPCQEPELQGSCLKMRKRGKNRNLTQCRGNYLKDNTQGEGERKLKGGKMGEG